VNLRITRDWRALTFSEMHAPGTFLKRWIPLTEFVTEKPHPIHTSSPSWLVKQDPGGNEVARLTVVGPVSTRDALRLLHSDGDQEAIATTG